MPLRRRSKGPARHGQAQSRVLPQQYYPQPSLQLCLDTARYITSRVVSISLHLNHAVKNAHCMEEAFKFIIGLRKPNLLQYLRLLMRRGLPCMCSIPYPIIVSLPNTFIPERRHRFMLHFKRYMQVICVEMLDHNMPLLH
jgi:hypothetical protein